MSDELLNDDQSHYEVSLTAGQAFLAFVLLLLSLAASFAFGLIIGRGQGDERLVVKKEPAVISEASVLPKKNPGRIVELGVKDDDFQADPAATDTVPVVTEDTAGTAATDAAVSASTEKPAAAPPASEATPPVAASQPAPAKQPEAKPAEQHASPSSAPVPHYAQLLTSADQKTAESLAARLIDKGFNSAYVERASSPKGPVFKVRIKFGSEAEARAAEPKLHEFSNDVWITAK